MRPRPEHTATSSWGVRGPYTRAPAHSSLPSPARVPEPQEPGRPAQASG